MQLNCSLHANGLQMVPRRINTLQNLSLKFVHNCPGPYTNARSLLQNRDGANNPQKREQNMPVLTTSKATLCTQCGASIAIGTSIIYTPRNNALYCHQCKPMESLGINIAPGRYPAPSTVTIEADSELIEETEESQNGIVVNSPTLSTLDPLSGQIFKAIEPHIDNKLSIAIRANNSKLDAKMERIAKQVSEQTSKQITINIPHLSVTKTIANSHPDIPMMLASIACRQRVWLHGPAGSGKTTIAKQIAETLGYELVCISLSAGSTKSEITGFIGGHGAMIHSKLRHGIENGRVVILLDEFDNSSGNLSTVCNTGLANFIWDFPDKQVVEHPECVIMVATNTNMRGGDAMYPERETQGAATISRFAYYEIAYDEKAELQWSLAYANDSRREDQIRIWVSTVQSYRASAARQRLQIAITPRASLFGAQMLSTGFLDSMHQSVVIDRLSDMFVFQGCDSGIKSLLKGGK